MQTRPSPVSVPHASNSSISDDRPLTSLEVCAGAGGQALGIERAGFRHAALLERDQHACETLRLNFPGANVIEEDLRTFDPSPYRGVDLFCGGVPCQPFSQAGKMAGRNDERDLFLEALRIIREAEPRAILLENVKGLLQPKFDGYRLEILSELQRLGYDAEWQVLDASDFGVPQTRRRSILVGFREGLMHRFVWPLPHSNYVGNPWTITAALYDMVAARGWKGVEEWAELADCTASTIVGGSSLKRGADLGQPHSAEAWAKKGINPRKIANDPPGPDDKDLYLTNRMLARLQDFPHDWKFSGPKQAVFRQIANAFPPVVALFLGCAIRSALTGTYIDPRNTLRLYNRSVFRLKKPDAPLAAEQIAMSKPVVRSRPSNTSFVPLQKLRRHSYLQEQDDSD